MTWKEWEIQLMEGLKFLPIEEKAKIAEYYQEMYGDKLEAGIPEEEILKEFGDPKACAEKILSENGEEKAPAQEPLNVESPIVEIKAKKEEPSTVKRVFSIIGFVVLTVLSVFAVLALGALALLFSGVALEGIIYSIFACFSGMEFGGVLANFGLGLAISGLGVLLFLVFAWLTKLVGTTCKQKLTAYERRIKNEKSV